MAHPVVDLSHPSPGLEFSQSEPPRARARARIRKLDNDNARSRVSCDFFRLLRCAGTDRRRHGPYAVVHSAHLITALLRFYYTVEYRLHSSLPEFSRASVPALAGPETRRRETDRTTIFNIFMDPGDPTQNGCKRMPK